MASLWSNRFETKKGRWVFVPTSECRAAGQVIRKQIASRWDPPRYLYQFRKGGHVSALQLHIANTYFARLDLANYFGSINKTRITRVLKSMAPYRDARQWAELSVVPDPDHPMHWMLPFGFVQSPIIAALSFSRSALGSSIERISTQPNLTVSCYVDDIIISSTNKALVEHAIEDVTTAVMRSAFRLNEEKCEGPTTAITAFNIHLSHRSLMITKERMERFKFTVNNPGSAAQICGIKTYIRSVNGMQIRNL